MPRPKIFNHYLLRSKFLLLTEKYINAFTVALALVLPNLIWIMLDKSLWWGDPGGYALASVGLYKNLMTNQRAWLLYLFTGYKGPFILWAGQFFVGLGYLIGSINFALLLLPMLSSYIALVLLFKTFKSLFNSKKIAFLGALAVSSSPLFNGLARGFWIEPLQVAVVAWFVYSLVQAKKWGFYFALAQFIIAGSLAMLIKASSPVYLMGSAVAFWVIIFRSTPSMKLDRKHLFFLLVAGLFFLPTVVFYLHNLKGILGFAHFAATNAMFGMGESKFDRWIQNIKEGIFLPITGWLAFFLVLSGGIKTIQQKTNGHFGIICKVAIFQIGIFFAVWLSSPNDDSRYFLPALPYFIILVCWALKTLNNRVLTFISVSLFLIQWLVVTSFAFDSNAMTPAFGIKPLKREPEKNMKIIREIMPLATRDSALIFDLHPEFGAVEFQFELAKKNLTGGWSNSCLDVTAFFNFNRQEIDTAKINADTVWQNILRCKPDYYITWNNRLSTAQAEMEIKRIDKYNGATVKYRWAVAAKMDTCSLYKLVPFPAYPELLAYKRL
jgi:hypothetical protein